MPALWPQLESALGEIPNIAPDEKHKRPAHEIIEEIVTDIKEINSGMRNLNLNKYGNAIRFLIDLNLIVRIIICQFDFVRNVTMRISLLFSTALATAISVSPALSLTFQDEIFVQTEYHELTSQNYVATSGIDIAKTPGGFATYVGDGREKFTLRRNDYKPFILNAIGVGASSSRGLFVTGKGPNPLLGVLIGSPEYDALENTYLDWVNEQDDGIAFESSISGYKNGSTVFSYNFSDEIDLAGLNAKVDEIVVWSALFASYSGLPSQMFGFDVAADLQSDTAYCFDANCPIEMSVLDVSITSVPIPSAIFGILLALGGLLGVSKRKNTGYGIIG